MTSLDLNSDVKILEMYSGLMKRHSLRFILLVHCTCTCRSMHLHKNIFPNLYQMIKLAIGKYLIKLISLSLLYDYSKINQILQSKNKKAFKLILEFLNSNPCKKKKGLGCTCILNLKTIP